MQILVAPLLVVIFILQAAYAQQITIIGNERPLIAGIQHDITCIFNGQTVAKIEWLLVFSESDNDVVVYISDDSGAFELVLSLTPGIDRDGEMFICRVTNGIGAEFEQNISLTVQELEHTLEIVPSQPNPVLACRALTLTCVAKANRPPLLTWIDENNNTVTSSPGINVSQSLVVGNMTMRTITFDPLRTSHAALYTCTCEIVYPVSSRETSYLLEVQIPPPIVTTLRDPDPASQLITGDRLVLTCNVEISVYVDTSTIVKLTWEKVGSGSSSLHDPPRVVVSSSSHSSSLTINSLLSSDTGTYKCIARICESGNRPVNDSISVCSTENVSASLDVEIFIEYEVPCDYKHSSPPYYRPCTSISLTCQAYGADQGLIYSWSSTNIASFVSGSTAQTVSVDMLTYNDGGVHTCCIYDSEGNFGCDKIEMVIKGDGIYIDDSEYINGVSIPDNDIVVPKSAPCVNCKLDMYCCSDSALNNMLIEFPNGAIKETADDFYNINVEQLPTTAQVRAYNYDSHLPQQYGLYTCLIGDEAAASVAVYSSLPGAPRVYYGGYDCNDDCYEDYILNITCSTSDSPPTKVQWYRNGQLVDVDSADYDAVQYVTDRKNLYYDNVLYVRNACFAAGRHEFTCMVNNSQGSDSHTVHTYIPVYESTEITYEGSEFDGETRVLTCTATLPEKLKDLLPFVEMEWVGPPGVALTTGNGIFIDYLGASGISVSSTLSFRPLSTDHSGLYRCLLNISKPELSPFFEREIRHEVIVVTRGLFQIQFGPVSPCVDWEPDLADILEQNLKRDMVVAINERCNCDFTERLIDMGEMSCHSSSSTATYRARLMALVYTAPQLLGMVWDWIITDGTFLLYHHGRMRLRLNFQCPLVIASFSEPECGLSVQEINKRVFLF